MDSVPEDNPAEQLFKQGMQYDYRQDKSPAAAVVARSYFKQAHGMGHTGASRALAHMAFEGRGGLPDREAGLLLLWQAFRKGDDEALEELEDMLGSYADSAAEPSPLELAADQVANDVQELRVRLKDVHGFMMEILRKYNDDRRASGKHESL